MGCVGAQSQRQLQVSLEAHGRYISSLIEQDRAGLQCKAAAAGAARAALATPHPLAHGPDGGLALCGPSRSAPGAASGGGTPCAGTSGAMSWGQMTHVTLPASTESPPPLLSNSSRLAGGAGDPQFLLQPPGEDAGTPPGGLPPMLLDTDLQAAAAVWDDGHKHMLHGSDENGLDGGLGLGAVGEGAERRQQRRRQPPSRLRQP